MDWRDQILKEFPSQVARLTLVADPDGLLLEEGLLQALRERGCEILPFENSIAFRFAYETRYRAHWDRKESTNDLIVVLPEDRGHLRSLPYDVWQTGRKLCLSLRDLFPKLHHKAVAAMDRADLDALYRAQIQHSISGQLGYNASRDFILRYVFDVDPELIKDAPDLLHVLLRRHYCQQRVPAVLDQRFIQILRQNRDFDDWPLEQIVSDREALFGFLQERWPAFIEHQVLGSEFKDHSIGYLSYSGPTILPFGHSDVRVYVDNLFVEGILHPISYPKAHLLSDRWVKVGLHLDPEADRLRRLERLIETVGDLIPAPDVRCQEWLTFAYRWAELIVLWHEANIAQRPELEERFQRLQQQVDAVFLAWVRGRYGGLYNQPAPVMLHHVPRAMARHLEGAAGTSPGGGKAKIALIVVDGLALDQWLILRDALARHWQGLKFREEALFAWLPTITPVSRQALFTGMPPLYYSDTIYRTDKDADGWENFWAAKGLDPVAVGYAKGLNERKHLAQVAELLAHPKVRVVGLVIDKVDRIMHGMQLGTAGMHNQVRQWASEQTFFAELLDLLFEHGFGILLTSDHGNIEAVGCGSPSEGAIADVRGERARVYPDPTLRAQVKEKFPEAIEWPCLGLPEDYLSLLASGRTAFVQEGKLIVGHGGISIEELIVPLIQIERRVI